MRRGYRAFAWGAPNRQRGTVTRRSTVPHAREKMAVRESGPGRPYPLGGDGNVPDPRCNPIASLLTCQLETGRTPFHRIRAPGQSRAIGHPLMGDAVYGPHFKTSNALGPRAQAALAALGRQALHAYLLTISTRHRGNS